MKKHIILAAMAATALFAACTNSDEEALTQGIPVNFTIGGEGIITRAITTLSGSKYVTSFENGDKFGVFSTGLKDNMNNATCTVGTGSTVSTDQSYFFKDQTTQVNFYAYYPAPGNSGMGTVNATAEQVEYTVANDQSSTNINRNDFMVAKAVSTGANNTVSLEFEHKLALIIVSLTDLENANKVTINNMLTKTTYKFSEETPTTDQNTRSDITMSQQNNTQEFWCMVPAQEIANGKELFTIYTSDNLRYTYTTTNDNLSVQAGGVFKITLKKSAAAVGTTLTATAKEWGNVTEFITDGETAEEYVTPVTAQTGFIKGTSKTDLSESSKNPNNYSWYLFGNAAADENPLSASENKWTYVTKDNTPVSNWDKNTLYYYGGETMMSAGLYKLTFKASSTEASKTIDVRLIHATTVNTYYGTCNTESGTYNARTTCTLGNNEQEFTVYINTSRYATASTNNVTEDNTANFKYFLCFSMKTEADQPSTTYTISNIKLIRQ